MSAVCTSTALQPQFNGTCIALQPQFNGTSIALPLHCHVTSMALQQHRKKKKNIYIVALIRIGPNIRLLLAPLGRRVGQKWLQNHRRIFQLRDSTGQWAIWVKINATIYSHLLHWVHLKIHLFDLLQTGPAHNTTLKYRTADWTCITGFNQLYNLYFTLPISQECWQSQVNTEIDHQKPAYHYQLEHPQVSCKRCSLNTQKTIT